MQNLWTVQILWTTKTEEDATAYKQDENPIYPSQSDIFSTEYACWLLIVNDILLQFIVNKRILLSFFFFFCEAGALNELWLQLTWKKSLSAEKAEQKPQYFT